MKVLVEKEEVKFALCENVVTDLCENNKLSVDEGIVAVTTLMDEGTLVISKDEGEKVHVGSLDEIWFTSVDDSLLQDDKEEYFDCILDINKDTNQRDGMYEYFDCDTDIKMAVKTMYQ